MGPLVAPFLTGAAETSALGSGIAATRQGQQSSQTFDPMGYPTAEPSFAENLFGAVKELPIVKYGPTAADFLLRDPYKAIEWGNGGGVQEGPTGDPLPAPEPYSTPLDQGIMSIGQTTSPQQQPDPQDTTYGFPAITPQQTKTETLPVDQLSGIMYSVKQKGGDWREGAITDLAKVVKLDAGMMGNVEEQKAKTIGKQDEINEIDRQLVNLEKRKLEVIGTEKEQAFQNAIDARIRDRGVLEQDLTIAQNDELIQNWVDKKFTKYAQTDMGTPNDPVLDVLEKYSTNIYQIPETDFLTGGRSMAAILGQERVQDRYPELGTRYPDRPMNQDVSYREVNIGEATPAQLWEIQTDSLVGSYPSIETVKHYKRMNPDNYPAWMDKVDQMTRVHTLDEPRVKNRLEGYETSVWEQFSDETSHAFPGMKSTINSLRKGLAPEAYGLENVPDNLRLKPNALDKMTVPQAVEHAAKLTEWQTTNSLLEDRNNKVYTQAMDMGGGFEWKRIGNKTTDQKTIDEIKKALSFESDNMSHCVGRGDLYCNKIAGGNTAIYSLRDPKGLPHTTIEMTIDIPNQVKNDILSQTHDSMMEASADDIVASAEMALTRWAAENPDKLVRTIEQVKGHGDRKPSPQYIPMVQRFIIEHPYPISDINMDQGNTDLIKLDTLSDSARAKFDQMFPDNNGIWGREEDVEKVKTELFAQGGLVSASYFLPRN